jgi:hypothetical protein
MLSDVADQQHLVVASDLPKEIPHLLRRSERGFIDHVQPFLGWIISTHRTREVSVYWACGVMLERRGHKLPGCFGCVVPTDASLGIALQFIQGESYRLSVRLTHLVITTNEGGHWPFRVLALRGSAQTVSQREHQAVISE